MIITVKNNQTIWDIALQYSGSLEAVVDILQASGKTSTELFIGEEITIPYVSNKRVAQFFRDNNISLSTSSQPLGEDEFEPVPNPGRQINIKFNGLHVETVSAPSTVDYIIKDTNDQIIDIEVEAENRTIIIPASGSGWVRTPEWFQLEDVTINNNSFSGLWLVFETQLQSHNPEIRIDSSVSSFIDWGDGSDVNSVNGTVMTTTYDYNSLPGIVLQDENGENYKQVVINITFPSANFNLFLDVTSKRFNINSFVDIAISSPNMSNVYFIAFNRKSYNLQRLAIYSNNLSTFNQVISGCPLREFYVDTSTFTQVDYTLVNLGNLTLTGLNSQPYELINSVVTTSTIAIYNTPILEIGKIILPNVLNSQSGFSLNRFLKRIDEVDLSSATNCITSFQENYSLESIRIMDISSATDVQVMFGNCPFLREVNGGELNVPNLINGAQMFLACHSLQRMKLITSGNLTSIFQTFVNNRSIKEIEITDCSSVTNALGCVTNCYSLELLILYQLAISIDLSGTNLSSDAMVVFFNNIADLTSLSSESINIQNTPASLSLTSGQRDIALNKNWTLIG